MRIKTVRSFEKNHKIPRIIWDQIFHNIPYTPSSFGLKPWKFFIIENKNYKNKLKKAFISENNIQQLENSSAIVLILGDQDKKKLANYIYQQKFLNQEFNQETKDQLLKKINQHYDDMNILNLKNELYLEAGIVATHFMIEAQSLGYNGCFIGGCYYNQLNNILNIPERYLPIILFSLGKENKNLETKKQKKNILKLDINHFFNFL
ncbi:nitroreductase family protein [Candidatus Phytoplasma pini]|uniref:Nitroreductase n=1 Tax=Candidatus Phytoplasma pini TaxID=267362 RepID=A0A559KJK6_9MOLU|nr:nitroreductase family protein [Candidatus Phytoplasma pini]TVY12314.1 nitroreductase [Candidatus Phytoplasma pini]